MHLQQQQHPQPLPPPLRPHRPQRIRTAARSLARRKAPPVEAAEAAEEEDVEGVAAAAAVMVRATSGLSRHDRRPQQPPAAIRKAAPTLTTAAAPNASEAAVEAVEAEEEVAAVAEVATTTTLRAPSARMAVRPASRDNSDSRATGTMPVPHRRSLPLLRWTPQLRPLCLAHLPLPTHLLRRILRPARSRTLQEDSSDSSSNRRSSAVRARNNWLLNKPLQPQQPSAPAKTPSWTRQPTRSTSPHLPSPRSCGCCPCATTSR